LWLAAQVFVLCLVSFLAGAAITAIAMRNRQPVPVMETTSEPEPEPELDPGPEVVIKASKKSMRYHTPDSPYYERVSSALTFPSAEEAELAGYTAWNTRKTPAKA
jgi:hypothetical protein